jgi:predicted metal-dependent peptidase
MQSQAMDRLKKARAKMLVKHPFFATLMMSMPMIETQMIPTAATDMKQLFINPDFVESVDDDVLMFVIAHEIMHTALVHGMRLSGRDPLRWNVATDYAINLILKDSNFKIWPQALLDEKYRDLSADNIYNQLKKEDDDQQQQQQQGQGRQQGQPDPNAQPQPGQQPSQAAGAGGQQPPPPPGQQPQPGSGPPTAGQPGNQHHSPMLGDLIQPDAAGDPVAEDRLRKDIQQRVAQAASIARMTGNMPGSLERFVQQVLEPKVPWYETLRHLMTEHDQVDEDWMHRNRRFATYLPTDHAENRLGIAIGIGDTSGSISDEELIDMGSEFTGICEQTKPEEIRMVWADTHVQSVQVFEPGDVIDLEPKGGGGTDMRVPLKYAEQFEPRIVVLFTDGHTPWPKEEPPFPLIVCCTTQVPVPIGEVIRI